MDAYFPLLYPPACGGLASRLAVRFGRTFGSATGVASDPVRLALTLPLVVFGLVLLATEALPLGLCLIAAGVWFYERPGGRGDESFIALLMLAGAIGALAVVAQFAWQHLTGSP